MIISILHWLFGARKIPPTKTAFNRLNLTLRHMFENSEKEYKDGVEISLYTRGPLVYVYALKGSDVYDPLQTHVIV